MLPRVLLSGRADTGLTRAGAPCGRGARQAWFSFLGRNALLAARSRYRGSLDETWGASSGPGPGRGLLFEAHGSASVRTPACVQVRAPPLAPMTQESP